MRPEVFSLREIVDMEVRWNVPPYQRHYAWGSSPKKEDGLVPKFWEDVKDKALARTHDMSDIPNYFGAIICKEYMDPALGRSFDIVDGQQRITTIFLLLIAIREVSHIWGFHRFDDEIDRCLFLGQGKSTTKLHSSRDDKNVFPELAKCSLQMVQQGALGENFDRKGEVKGDKQSLKRKRILLAYNYLIKAVREFVLEESGDAKDEKFEQRAEKILQTLLDGFLDGFEIIVISLREGSDAQGIFHALNGRSLPLSHFDLIRNGIFLRARDERLNLERFLDEHWGLLDDEDWTDPSNKPLADVLISHMLVAERARVIIAKRIAAEYQEYEKRSRDEGRFKSVKDEVRILRDHASTYREMLKYADRPIGPDNGLGLARASSTLKKFGASALYPTLLWINSPRVKNEERRERLFQVMGSYVARRAACSLTTKSYKQMAPILVRAMRDWDEEVSFDRSSLVRRINAIQFSEVDAAARKAESFKMPTDSDIRRSSMKESIYVAGSDGGRGTPLQNRSRNSSAYYLLAEIERHLRSKFDNPDPVRDNLCIDHVMPIDWSERGSWPFPAGGEEALNDRAARRNRLIFSLGNLTLTASPLGCTSWQDRQREIADHHFELDMNNYFKGRMKWDEDDIQERGEYLAEIICRIWPWDSLFPDSAGDGGGGAEPEGTGEGEAGAGE